VLKIFYSTIYIEKDEQKQENKLMANNIF